MALETGHLARLAQRRGEAGEARDEDAVAKNDGTGCTWPRQRGLPNHVLLVAPRQGQPLGLAAAHRTGSTKLRPIRSAGGRAPDGKRKRDLTDHNQKMENENTAVRHATGWGGHELQGKHPPMSGNRDIVSG